MVFLGYKICCLRQKFINCKCYGYNNAMDGSQNAQWINFWMVSHSNNKVILFQVWVGSIICKIGLRWQLRQNHQSIITLFNVISPIHIHTRATWWFFSFPFPFSFFKVIPLMWVLVSFQMYTCGLGHKRSTILVFKKFTCFIVRFIVHLMVLVFASVLRHKCFVGVVI